jgi:mannose-1-phosphate guanylyltransferase/phosphomannomutase
VYIGRNTEICDGAVIGPYAVVDDNCYVGDNAKIRYSTLLENACVSRDCAVTGALVCSGAALKKGATMFENSVAGSGSIIGENSCVKQNVLVWPGKIICKGKSVFDNVKYGNFRNGIMNENGFGEEGGARLTPETCVRIGAAVGSTRNGRKCGIATDGSRSAQVLRHAVISGLLGVGASVWDFGCCFEAQLNFLVNFCGLGSGLFISGRDKKEIRICGEGGLSIPRFFERSIESYINKGEIREIDEKSVKELNETSSVGLIYKQELLKNAPYGLADIGVKVKCDNPIAGDML